VHHILGNAGLPDSDPELEQFAVETRCTPLWLGVTTAHPTAEWIANQLTAACGWEQLPPYLIRDRDACYGDIFVRRVRSLGIRDHPTSPRSPWQNGYVERLIGSIRRECLDHIVVVGEQHLRHILMSYMEYYNAV
jgi:transposase InsO family protein